MRPQAMKDNFGKELQESLSDEAFSDGHFYDGTGPRTKVTPPKICLQKKTVFGGIGVIVFFALLVKTIFLLPS